MEESQKSRVCVVEGVPWKAGDQGRRKARGLTPQPVVEDVLEHSDQDAEGDGQVAERQGAGEDVGDGAHGLAEGHHVDHQRVAKERQDEDEHAGEHEGQLGAPRQLRGVDQRPQPVQRDELRPCRVVVPQQPGELLRGDVELLHAARAPRAIHLPGLGLPRGGARATGGPARRPPPSPAGRDSLRSGLGRTRGLPPAPREVLEKESSAGF